MRQSGFRAKLLSSSHPTAASELVNTADVVTADERSELVTGGCISSDRGQLSNRSARAFDIIGVQIACSKEWKAVTLKTRR